MESIFFGEELQQLELVEMEMIKGGGPVTTDDIIEGEPLYINGVPNFD